MHANKQYKMQWQCNEIVQNNNKTDIKEKKAFINWLVHYYIYILATLFNI